MTQQDMSPRVEYVYADDAPALEIRLTPAFDPQCRFRASRRSLSLHALSADVTLQSVSLSHL